MKKSMLGLKVLLAGLFFLLICLTADTFATKFYNTPPDGSCSSHNSVPCCRRPGDDCWVSNRDDGQTTLAIASMQQK